MFLNYEEKFLTFSNIGFLILTIVLGDIRIIAYVKPQIMLLTFLSGILGIGAGVGLYIININIFGPVVTSVVLLLTPLFSSIFAFLLMREMLTIWQIIFGFIMLCGCYIIITEQRRIKWNT